MTGVGKACAAALAAVAGAVALVGAPTGEAQVIQNERDRVFTQKQAALDLRRVWRFDEDPNGSSPAGFMARTVGTGPPGQWTVRADPAAASAPNLLTQTAPCDGAGCFHVLLAQDVAYDYFDLTFKVRPAAGPGGGIGGVVFGVQDERNFYAVLVDFGRHELSVVRVQDGRETELGRASVVKKDVPWHIVRVQRNTIISKEFIETFFDNALAVSVEDHTFGSGQIGLVARGPSPIQFDNIHAIRIYSQRPLSPPAAY